MTAPDPVLLAIAAHRTAYAAFTAALAIVHDLNEANALYDELGDPDAIRATLTTIHGPHATEEIEGYFAARAACEVAGVAEDLAWTQVVGAVPDTAEGMRAWCAYVIEHAAKADEVVMLQRALEHVCGLLADQLE